MIAYLSDQLNTISPVEALSAKDSSRAVKSTARNDAIISNHSELPIAEIELQKNYGPVLNLLAS